MIGIETKVEDKKIIMESIGTNYRYQFLAFDFEETVDMTGDNCRLLLLRLKVEGWKLGKTKVFIKYYAEEFLSRYFSLTSKN